MLPNALLKLLLSIIIIFQLAHSFHVRITLTDWANLQNQLPALHNVGIAFLLSKQSERGVGVWEDGESSFLPINEPGKIISLTVPDKWGDIWMEKGHLNLGLKIAIGNHIVGPIPFRFGKNGGSVNINLRNYLTPEIVNDLTAQNQPMMFPSQIQGHSQHKNVIPTHSPSAIPRGSAFHSWRPPHNFDQIGTAAERAQGKRPIEHQIGGGEYTKKRKQPMDHSAGRFNFPFLLPPNPGQHYPPHSAKRHEKVPMTTGEGRIAEWHQPIKSGPEFGDWGVSLDDIGKKQTSLTNPTGEEGMAGEHHHGGRIEEEMPEGRGGEWHEPAEKLMGGAMPKYYFTPNQPHHGQMLNFAQQNPWYDDGHHDASLNLPPAFVQGNVPLPAVPPPIPALQNVHAFPTQDFLLHHQNAIPDFGTHHHDADLLALLQRGNMPWQNAIPVVPPSSFIVPPSQHFELPPQQHFPLHFESANLNEQLHANPEHFPIIEGENVVPPQQEENSPQSVESVTSKLQPENSEVAASAAGQHASPQHQIQLATRTQPAEGIAAGAGTSGHQRPIWVQRFPPPPPPPSNLHNDDFATDEPRENLASAFEDKPMESMDKIMKKSTD